MRTSGTRASGTLGECVGLLGMAARYSGMIGVEGRYFSLSPFDHYRFAEELKIPLNK